MVVFLYPDISRGSKFGFWPKSHVRTCSKFGFDDFEKNWAYFLLIKFANSSVFGDVREVQSSVLGPNEMFECVRSSIL